MRSLFFGVLICTIIQVSWGKPVESVTTAPNNYSTGKEHPQLSTTNTPTTSSPTVENKSTENLSKGVHSEITTTKKPELSHETTEANTPTTNKPIRIPNEKENKVSTTVKSPIGEHKGTTAKPNKEPTTTKMSHWNGKKEEKSHTSEQENLINDLINEGKTIVFNGICGPEGCAVKGDVYDDLPTFIN